MALLLGLVLAEAAGLAWCLLRPSAPSGFGTAKDIARRFKESNPIRESLPTVDFTKYYPGHSAEEIDYLQRECSTLRYIYSPFVEFRLLPGKGRFVEISQAGFRVGPEPQSWPPGPAAYSVFVFGGSTTFGFDAFDDQTVVVHLQRELQARMPGSRVHCYNFGMNSYISSQERALLEVLMLNGIVPTAAIFIDGLNEYEFPDGQPQLSPILFRIVTPDLTPPTLMMRNEEEASKAVDALLARYERNLRVAESVTTGNNVRVAFIGQPTPWVDYPTGPETYPFERKEAHQLCRWGYVRFKSLALSGRLGSRFVWCGDAFSTATTAMYADGVHYSAAGAKVLAKTIADRVIARNLLP
jgi:lysophospholipase L1-like esterase